jgi:uncharacterized protein YbaA (DUF1428 family)
MSKYVDGFVFVVPNDKTEEYIKTAEEGARMWKKHGALEYFECKGDDLVPPQSEEGVATLAFPVLTSAKPDETVWFSFIVFKSKQHRDEVNARVYADMEKEMENYKGVPMPFDMNHMAYGGFEVVVEG